MTAKRGLGKGLSALLPTEEEKAAPKNDTIGTGGSGPASEEAGGKSAVIMIAIEKLVPNPNQPRKSFNSDELTELADSIRQQGVIQPIIAEETGDGNYSIVAGERRTRAAKLAGLTEIPAIIRQYSEEKRMVVSLIENIQRSNLNPIEEAEAYRQLMKMENLSQDEAAGRVGKNRATVANTLRLLKLPGQMQESMRNGELSSGHARAVLSLTDSRSQEALFREIVSKGISVREAEKRAAILGQQGKTQKKPAKRRAPEITAMEEKFITRLGTKVEVKGDLNKGSVVIDYYSMEDLNRLYEIIGN